jgi:hypothetical protein
MPFWDRETIPPFQILPGVRVRAPFGVNLMLSYLEMDAGAIVPLHIIHTSRAESFSRARFN